jgi:hypothetical protein
MRHGTDNGYTNGGCRCAECTAAHRTVRRRREHETGRALPWSDYLYEREILQ